MQHVFTTINAPLYFNELLYYLLFCQVLFEKKLSSKSLISVYVGMMHSLSVPAKPETINQRLPANR